MPSLPRAMCPSRMDILAHILMQEQTLHQCVRPGWTPLHPGHISHAIPTHGNVSIQDGHPCSHTDARTNPTSVCPSRMDTFAPRSHITCHPYPWQCVHPGWTSLLTY